MLRSVTATRYVTPLREGGSLPGLMEADDLGTYVVKFTGAGQGRKALVSEIICAALAARLELAVPELVLVDVDPVLADNEPDEEVQDLLRRSPGRNLGLDYLPGSLDLDAHAFAVDPQWAARVLWFDAVVGNVDRTWRNPNMLFWHGRPYLIDHGAALTFAHDWARADPRRPYAAVNHALLGVPPDPAAWSGLAEGLDAAAIEAAVADVPAEWLTDEPGFDSPAAVRAAYGHALAGRVRAEAERIAVLQAAIEVGVDRSPRRTHRPSWLEAQA